MTQFRTKSLKSMSSVDEHTLPSPKIAKFVAIRLTQSEFIFGSTEPSGSDFRLSRRSLTIL